MRLFTYPLLSAAPGLSTLPQFVEFSGLEFSADDDAFPDRFEFLRAELTGWRVTRIVFTSGSTNGGRFCRCSGDMTPLAIALFDVLDIAKSKHRNRHCLRSRGLGHCRLSVRTLVGGELMADCSASRR